MEMTFGNFIKQKRLEKNLTQKNLASKLFVSESAVSKWEKDVAHPDITLLPKLSEILGVTEHELITASIDKELQTEKKQAKKWRTLTSAWDMFFYISYAITIVTCFICNLAVNGTLSWFWIVLSALVLSFSITNLPKLITKFRLIFIPLSMYLSLCLLLGVCAIYTSGNWFFIPCLAVFLALTIIFVPIYISKYKIFEPIKKYNDFISLAVDFITLNILLLVIYAFTITNGYANINWYFKIALPITVLVYVAINLLICVKFFKFNKLLKTSLILFLIDLFLFIPPLFIKVSSPSIQEEIEDFNILKANLSAWNLTTIDNNISLIIALSILLTSAIFFICGTILQLKNNKNN